VNIHAFTFENADRLQMGAYPVLDVVLQRWARSLENTLFERFGLEVYAGASVWEDMRFSAFHASLKEPRPVYLFGLEPHPSQGLLVLDNLFAGLCLSGGRGGPAKLTPDNHQKLDQVAQDMARSFDRAWEDIAPIKTRLDKITTYLFRARVVNHFEPCLVAHVHLSGQGFSSRLSWCLPRVMLESLLPKLEQTRVIPPVSPLSPKRSLNPQKPLDQSQVRLTVDVGNMITIPAKTPLVKGAVFALHGAEGAAPGQVIVRLNGKPVLSGELGDSQGQMALRVTGPATSAPPKKVLPAHTPFRPTSWPRA